MSLPTPRRTGFDSLRNTGSRTADQFARGVRLGLEQKQAAELSEARKLAIQKTLDELKQRNLQATPQFHKAVGLLFSPDVDLTSPQAQLALGTVFQASPEVAGMVLEGVQAERLAEIRAARQGRSTLIPANQLIVGIPKDFPNRAEFVAELEALGDTPIPASLVTSRVNAALRESDIERKRQDALARQDQFRLSHALNLEKFGLSVSKFDQALAEARRLEETGGIFNVKDFVGSIGEVTNDLFLIGIDDTRGKDAQNARAQAAEITGLAYNRMLRTRVGPFDALYAEIQNALKNRPELIPDKAKPGITESVKRWIRGNVPQGVQDAVTPPFNFEETPGRFEGTGPSGTTPPAETPGEPAEDPEVDEAQRQAQFNADQAVQDTLVLLRTGKKPTTEDLVSIMQKNNIEVSPERIRELAKVAAAAFLEEDASAEEDSTATVR